MPASIKQALWQHSEGRRVFVNYWYDCIDFALGAEALLSGHMLDQRGRAFLANAEAELKGALAQLLLEPPNLKAIISLRLACEIFLKCFLINMKKLTDQDLKKIGHKLGELAQKCFDAVPLPEFEIIAKSIAAYPDLSARYTGNEHSGMDVFDGVFITQMAAAAITRHLTGQDSRKTTSFSTDPSA